MITLYVSELAGPAPPRLVVRIGLGEFGPGCLGMAGRAGKPWSRMGAEFNAFTFLRA